MIKTSAKQLFHFGNDISLLSSQIDSKGALRSSYHAFLT